MKAVMFDRFGPPEVVRVGQVAMPVPSDSEVVVQVIASTINPTDVLMRSGQQAAIMDHLIPPYIAGMEFSGFIHSIGNGTHFAVGEPVIGIVNPRRPEGGAHAQYVKVPASSVAVVSRDILLEDVATVPMNAVTAKLALDMTGLKAGQTLLVTGGAGMLGGSVIQLAHRLGIVVVTIGATAQVAFLNALGADRVIERGSDIVKEIWKHYPCGVDALIDGALIGQEICAVVKDGGSAISLRKSHPIKDPRLHVDYVSVLNGMENAEIIGMVARLTSDGVLKPRVAEGGYFNFEQAEAAFRYFENGKHSGRIILNFANEDT